MKKKVEHEDDGDEKEQEVLKAVAQAWHSHSGSCRPLNEFDAHRRKIKNKPTRFKIEAMNKQSSTPAVKPNWDFKQSLWDSYEIVAVSKRLETGLVLDDNNYNPFEETSRVHRRQKESKNSLRNLFNLVSSRRFKES
ncbi:hypothetical protein HS088_TW08G00313 [Tripterygium wilfordii]|uniref:Uncharacterized protein n=1 Tax=Tripterygium wilfordii TaxID=458696 RepID=A0A7J7DCD3_TRIWF|nr:uncharacterized protein LOC120004623 [Tripterygium wilfordii]KAF5743726.1 hypothetical protein HS088_TW08G00313 [Tripterygium wilfordii]